MWLADRYSGIEQSKSGEILIGHHPIYTGKASGSALAADAAEHRYGGTPELIQMLDPIVQRHGVPLYFNGHDHDLHHVVHEGAHYVCTGAGSLTDEECYLGDHDFCSLRSGFVACAANRKQLRLTYLDYRGAELHIVDIPRPGWVEAHGRATAWRFSNARWLGSVT